MASYSTESIRNIALVGHGGSGKTTLVEALLHHAGVIQTPGSVEKGTTVCDFDPQEKAHQHSLDSALVRFQHEGNQLNLIDTPGFPDFIGHAISALSAVETAAVVVNGQVGIEAATRRIFERAGARRLCRMIVVNKIDADELELAGVLAQIQEQFGRECLPINLPAARGSEVVDCFFEPEGESDFLSVAKAHEAIMDQVVELDEELMSLYLEGEQIRPDQLHDSFEKALREGHLVPVCFVSARTGAGVGALIRIFDRLLPNPAEGNAEPFTMGQGEQAQEYLPEPDPTKPVLAHAFKVNVDPFVGKLALFRIHQGTVTKDSQLFINDGRKPFKVGHLFQFFGKDHPEVADGIPGDICAVAKVDEIHRGDCLHDSRDHDRVSLRPLQYPAPLFGLAIRAQNRNDEQKLSDTLQKLAEEDPCIAVEYNQSTRETVLRGLSDLHLRVSLEKMRDRYHVGVETAPPKIAYRETIAAPAEGHYRHKKQTGGAGQFGEVFLRVQPRERGAGFEFASEIVGGAIPAVFLPAIEKGIREALASGAVAGYPLQDVRVVVYDGKHHPVDSKEVAFVTAGREAFLDAVRKGRPMVLEPIVDVEVTAPGDCVGAITGDLSGRRGRISGTDTLASGMIAIRAQVPLAELEGYESQLKSMTGGHGTYSIELGQYEPVPANVQQQLMAAYRPQASDSG